MILVLGDINVDLTAPLTSPLAVGGDCLSPEITYQCGGVGLNTAIMLARLGIDVRLAGCAGQDWFGDFALAQLRRETIDINYVQRSARSASGLMYIAVSPDGQRTIFGSRGANAQLRWVADFERCLEGVAGLILFGYTFLSPSAGEVAARLLHVAQSRGILVALDVGMEPSRRIRERVIEIAGQVDILLANADEAAALTAENDLEAAFRQLARTGAGEAILKLGNRGCLVENEGQLGYVPSIAVQALDTTGAGDAFTAAYLAARVWGWSKNECGLLANAAGAAATLTRGAGEKLPTMASLRELMAGSHLPAEWEQVRCVVMDRLCIGVGSAEQHGSGGAS